MKFSEDYPQQGHVITAYETGNVSINGKTYQQSLIVNARQLDADWCVDSVEALLPLHVEKLLSFRPEIIIIGTGNKLIFPAIESYAAVLRQGIGIDFMDTGAACRTYNILISEGRNVVAGLILHNKKADTGASA